MLSIRLTRSNPLPVVLAGTLLAIPFNEGCGGDGSTTESGQSSSSTSSGGPGTTSGGPVTTSDGPGTTSDGPGTSSGGTDGDPTGDDTDDTDDTGDNGMMPRVCPSVATGSTLHVAESGSDDGAGTLEQPFRSVAKALAVAEPGDRVLLAAGTYRGRVVFPKSGTEGGPIILEGEPGAVVDGGDRVTGWMPAPEVGPHVYKNDTFTYEPFNMTWNDKYVLHLGENVDQAEGFTILNEGPEGWDTYGGTPYRSWDGVEAMFGSFDGVTYVRFASNVDPNDEDLTFAPNKRGALEIAGKSHITICNLTARGAYHIVKINEQSSHVIVSGNTIRGGHEGVAIERGSHDNLVTGNEITLDYVHSLDPNDPRHWFIWATFKIWSDYDRIGVNLFEAGSDNVVSENHIFQHWGGVQDQTGSQATDVEQYAQNLKVFGNHIEHIADDGLEPNGGEVNAEWHDNLVHDCNIDLRVKPPATGPMYIYNNRLSTQLAPTEHGENLGIYFHIGVTGNIFIYHNSISTHQAYAMGNQREVGAPNTWYVNNVFSAPRFGDGEGDANHPHFDYNWVGGDVVEADWMGPNNILAPDAAIWPDGDTALPVAPDSPLRAAGVDLSVPWTVDGEMHPPLPGMAPGYFDAIAPTLGAVQ